MFKEAYERIGQQVHKNYRINVVIHKNKEVNDTDVESDLEKVVEGSIRMNHPLKFGGSHYIKLVSRIMSFLVEHLNRMK